MTDKDNAMLITYQSFREKVQQYKRNRDHAMILPNACNALILATWEQCERTLYSLEYMADNNIPYKSGALQ